MYYRVVIREASETSLSPEDHQPFCCDCLLCSDFAALYYAYLRNIGISIFINIGIYISTYTVWFISNWVTFWQQSCYYRIGTCIAIDVILYYMTVDCASCAPVPTCMHTCGELHTAMIAEMHILRQAYGLACRHICECTESIARKKNKWCAMVGGVINKQCP